MSADLSPDTVVVRVTDDSPAGGGQGGTVYDSRMSVTLRRGGPDENQVLEGVRPVLVASDGARWVTDHWELDGPAFVEYELPVPAGTVGLQANSTVAQDYRIGMRQAPASESGFPPSAAMAWICWTNVWMSSFSVSAPVIPCT